MHRISARLCRGLRCCFTGLAPLLIGQVYEAAAAIWYNPMVCRFMRQLQRAAGQETGEEQRQEQMRSSVEAWRAWLHERYIDWDMEQHAANASNLQMVGAGWRALCRNRGCDQVQQWAPREFQKGTKWRNNVYSGIEKATHSPQETAVIFGKTEMPRQKVPEQVSARSGSPLKRAAGVEWRNSLSTWAHQEESLPDRSFREVVTQVCTSSV